jgi:hypothetical protein
LGPEDFHIFAGQHWKVREIDDRAKRILDELAPASRVSKFEAKRLYFMIDRLNRCGPSVPVSRALIPLLSAYSVGKADRLWPWGRTTAWMIVKALMRQAGIAECLCKPKALRHALPSRQAKRNTSQYRAAMARTRAYRDNCHYASAIGDEERNFVRRAWSSLELAIPDRTNPSF